MTIKKSGLLKLSASSIKTYEQCPRKWYFTYVTKEPKKDWPHLALGNFVHKVLELFHERVMREGIPAEFWGALMSETCKKVVGDFKLSKEHKVSSKDMLNKYLALIKAKPPDVVSNEQNFSIQLTEDTLIRGFIDRIDRDVERGYDIVDYKGLAVDTPIPTPSGWTTMGDLKVGDQVFGSSGYPTKVILKSEIHNRPCYRLTLSDNSTVVCDNVHLWNVGVSTELGEQQNIVLDADKLFELFISSHVQERTFFIQNHDPLQTNTASFVVDKSKFNDIINRQSIPAEYLRASFEQRLSLFNALMDTASGSWNKKRNLCSYVTKSSSFASDVAELIRTFGLSVVIRKASINSEDTFYISEFRPGRINPFKNSFHFKSVNRRVTSGKFDKTQIRRNITNMEIVPSVPTQCIGVDALDSLYVCGKGMILSHNTGKSKYLDEFQLLVYGLYLKDTYPDLLHFRGTYIALVEGPKIITYTFTKTDIERCREDILLVADKIRNDRTWEPKPQFLCSYCDFESICPAVQQAKFAKTDGWVTHSNEKRD